LILAVCASVVGLSAAATEGPVELQVLHAAEVSSPVTPTSWDGDIRRLPTVADWKPGDPVRIIPRRDGGEPSGEIDPEDVGPDFTPAREGEPLLGLHEEWQDSNAPASFTIPIVNKPGQGYTGTIPPDANGDVSALYYVQAVNGSGGSQFSIYDKTGIRISGPTLMETLGTGSCASGFGDPIILYDQLADRWVFSEFALSGNHLCVYVSKTNNPITGGFWAYNFTLTQFPDYPKYAVWPDAYYLTSNESSPAAYALDRNKMLTGAPATYQRFSAPRLAGFGFQALIPSDIDGPSGPPAGAPNYMARHRDDEVHNPATDDPTRDFIDLFQFHVDFTTPANSTFTGPISIPISEFDSTLCGTSSFSCFRQPTGTQWLDPLREVVMWRLAYRNFGDHETLVGNLVTDVGADRGGVRWFEFRKVGAGGWTVHQEGTFSPDTHNRWMGSLAMDGDGNIALGYNVVSLSVFPSLRYVGRLVTDPPGTLPQGEATLFAGTASNISNRYGDYAAMAVDPADDCTFWFTGEFNLSGNWSTRIGSFKFPGCGESTAPKPVPDGFFVPGVQMKAGRNGTGVDLTWDMTACPEQQYDLYYGALSDFSVLTGAICGLPPTGTASGLVIPDDSFWVLAGADGSQISSFGHDWTGTERVFTGWPGLCVETTQDTTATCP
jgi:hypothetical protein